MRPVSQKDMIIDSLKDGRVITPIHALTEFGCFRLAARISELRAEGYQIATEIVDNGDSRYAAYYLEQA